MARFHYRILTRPIREDYKPKDKIPRFLELMRWSGGIRCPHCRSPKVKRFRKAWKTHEGRYLYLCRGCRRQFTVTTGTALHHTHVPLATWLDAIALMKKSSRSLRPADLVHRLGVTHKTAVLMCSRLRRGMKGLFLQRLALAIRHYKSWERIYRNLFPDLYVG